MLKKIIPIIMLIILVSTAAAEVIMTLNFEGTGTTTYVVYDRHVDGTITFRTSGTSDKATFQVNLPARLPAGVQDYLVYFYRLGYRPKVYSSTKYCASGNTCYFNAPTITFNKHAECTAPIREFSLNSVNAGEPLLINVPADLDGAVYSPLKLNSEITSFIPPGYETYYAADTEIKLEITDSKGNVVAHGLTPIRKNLMVGSKETFDFEWTPTNAGTYNVKAISTVLDNKCETTKQSDYPATVEVYENLDNVCSVKFNEGIDLWPVQPNTIGQEVKITGTRESKQYIDGNARDLWSDVELKVYQNGQVIYGPVKPTWDLGDRFEFRWTPTNLGQYGIEVTGDTWCGAPEIHGPIDVNIQYTSSQNHQPQVDEIQDMHMDIGETRYVFINGRDYENAPLTYNVQVADTTTASCNLIGSMLRCTGNNYGTTTATVTASDRQYAGTETFTIRVTTNSNPVIISEANTDSIKNELYTYDIEATDADGDTLIYELREGPRDMKIDRDTGILTWTPEASGEYEVRVRVRDGRGGSDSQTFEIEVERPIRDTRADNILLSTTRIAGEDDFKAGETIHLKTGLENEDGRNFDALIITATIQEWGLRDRAGPFDLEGGETITRDMYLEIPNYAEPGTYAIRVTYNDDKFRRVVHREFTVE